MALALPPGTGGGMTPDELEEAKRKLEEEEKAVVPFEVGYRGWKLHFKEGEPRLGAVVHQSIWEPIDVEDVDPITGEVVISKEIRSDWDPEVNPPFERTSQGFYSLRSLDEVLRHYPGEDIYGAIIPYGKRDPGSLGFRSQFAQVSALFRRPKECFVCSKPAKYFVHNDDRFALCERCLKLVEKQIRAKGYTDEEIEAVLRKLADAYDAEIADLP